MGQIPPPWHGQAVATQQLFDHDWPGFEVKRIRMEFSSEMEEVGRFQLRKVVHMLTLLRDVIKASGTHKDEILFYPPASPNWIPILRDLVLLPLIRSRFGTVVYIYHAGGVGEWCAKSKFRRLIANIAYGQADLSLEVSRENPAPHQILGARQWAWTPYGVCVPPLKIGNTARQGPTEVLFVGSLQEGKGVLEVLKTALLLKQRGKDMEFRFRVVGPWFSKEFEEEAREFVSKFKLGGMISFPGQLTGDEKWTAYHDADVFFFPTHYASEAFPLVLIEALGCGLPIITTRWRGIPDMFDGCSVAKICEVRSPESYFDALLGFRTTQIAGANHALEARRFYEERYLPEDFLLQIQSLIVSTRMGNCADSKAGDLIPNNKRCMVPVQVNKTSRAIQQLESANLDPRPSNPRPSDTPPPLSEHDDKSVVTPYSDLRPSDSPPPLFLSAYLADQNPGYDRSFGISRMSQVVLEALGTQGGIVIETIASKTSQQAPEGLGATRILPWGTRRKSIRLLTDHFHPLFSRGEFRPDIHYFPKGYLPWLSGLCRPSVVTIHDTIIQYDEDHYPDWRKPWEYAYWALILKHTLRKADRILTVSESSKAQIHSFMDRHRIPRKEITVTYEPCMYEGVPQPEEPDKENYVIHLASCEPHKRTAHLIRWWHEAEHADKKLPTLHLIGTVPEEVAPLLASSRSIVKRPFLEDAALQAAYLEAKALILPSEIEGFGLPALEAYYLGTPVCFVKGTSVEEVLGVATTKGGFRLDSPDSLFEALSDVTAMSAEEIRQCGLKLRETYAAEKVAERMMKVFWEVKG